MCLIFSMSYSPRITVEKKREKKGKKKTPKAFLNLPLVGLSESFENARPDGPCLEFPLIGSGSLLFRVTECAGGPRERSVRLASDGS